MRHELRDEPAAWLAGGPIRITTTSAITATFRAGTTKVVRFAGPHRLYRAAGWDLKSHRLASAYGSWWLDENVLCQIAARIGNMEGWLPPELLHAALPAQYRGAAALCEDWNDMREMFRLELPVGQEITGLVGMAAPQPQRSTMDRSKRSTPFLVGGGEQVYFKKTFTLNSINPLWVYPTKLW